MLSRRAVLASLAAAAVGAACRTEREVRRATLSVDQFAERYVRLTLRLALHQPSLVEGWRGAEAWRPDFREPVEGIRRDIVEAHAAIGELRAEPGAGERLRYLTAQFAALAIAARRLGGETMPFFAEASAALALEPKDMTPAQAELAAARDVLEQTLAGGGPLRDRYAAFRRARAVAPSRVLPVFREAVVACQLRVIRQIRLPDAESVEIAAADAADVEAAATYQGDYRSRVTLGRAGPVDLAHLVWLAAHEAYPGHHMQHVLADRDCVRARGWRERELFPNFGRHQFYSEGVAEAGAQLLLDGDAFHDICRDLNAVAKLPADDLRRDIAVHRAVITLDGIVADIARGYLDGELNTEAATDRLADVLVPDPAGVLATIERRRTRVLSYPLGRRLVWADLIAQPPEGRWPRLAAWATMLAEPSD